MKIKTKDKINFLTKKFGQSNKEWKRLSQTNPKQFEDIFQRAKDGGTVNAFHGGIELNLPPFAGIDFSEYSTEEKQKHELFIQKTSNKLLEYVEEFNLDGACNSIPYFYKLFLQENGVPIDVEYGVFELDDKFSTHSWNSYNGKRIDITVYLQRFGISGDAVVLDEVIKPGKDNIGEYHRADQLPSNYLQNIEKATLRESELIATRVKSIELAQCKELLDIDSFLCTALRKNYNSCDVIKEEILPHYDKQYKHFVEHFVKNL